MHMNLNGSGTFYRALYFAHIISVWMCVGTHFNGLCALTYDILSTCLVLND